MIPWRRRVLVFLLMLLPLFTAAFIYAISTGCWPSGKILDTMSTVAALAAIAQLDVSGFWAQVLVHFSDEKLYPYGPPSVVVREIIDNPNTPVRTAIKQRVFLDPTTGAMLVILSTILGGVAIWL